MSSSVLHKDPAPPVFHREPVFNLPASIAGLAAVLVAIHAVRTLLLSPDADLEVLVTFAFIPLRYQITDPDYYLPGGFGAKVWTFVTYALLHANWVHLVVNLVWLLAFGTPVARRFGPARFALFCAVTAAAGALAHLLSHMDGMLPMIGASATVSGTMAAAIRFAFAPGAALGGGLGREGADHQPAGSLGQSLRDGRILAFVAVWFGLNLLFGIGITLPGADEAEVAWQAHVGGFLAGLLLFSIFDPVPSLPARAR